MVWVVRIELTTSSLEARRSANYELHPHKVSINWYKTALLYQLIGVRAGIRTRASSLATRNPEPLEDSHMVAEVRFELTMSQL